MTEEERERLAEQLRELDEAQAKISAARAPFDAAMVAVQGVRDALLERHEVDIAGRCEGCDRLLFVGDKGHHCEDGPILCEEHAPTWGDVKEQWEKHEDADPEERRDAIAAADAHVQAGGNLNDKVLYEL